MYKQAPYRVNEIASLLFANEKLYYQSNRIYPAVFVVLNPDTLQELGTIHPDGSGTIHTCDNSTLNFRALVPKKSTKKSKKSDGADAGNGSDAGSEASADHDVRVLSVLALKFHSLLLSIQAGIPVPAHARDYSSQSFFPPIEEWIMDNFDEHEELSSLGVNMDEEPTIEMQTQVMAQLLARHRRGYAGAKRRWQAARGLPIDADDGEGTEDDGSDSDESEEEVTPAAGASGETAAEGEAAEGQEDAAEKSSDDGDQANQDDPVLKKLSKKPVVMFGTDSLYVYSLCVANFPEEDEDADSKLAKTTSSTLPLTSPAANASQASPFAAAASSSSSSGPSATPAATDLLNKPDESEKRVDVMVQKFDPLDGMKLMSSIALRGPVVGFLFSFPCPWRPFPPHNMTFVSRDSAQERMPAILEHQLCYGFGEIQVS